MQIGRLLLAHFKLPGGGSLSVGRVRQRMNHAARRQRRSGLSYDSCSTDTHLLFRRRRRRSWDAFASLPQLAGRHLQRRPRLRSTIQSHPHRLRHWPVEVKRLTMMRQAPLALMISTFSQTRRLLTLCPLNYCQAGGCDSATPRRLMRAPAARHFSAYLQRSCGRLLKFIPCYSALPADSSRVDGQCWGQSLRPTRRPRQRWPSQLQQW